jgi:uncharacterized iron-regulated membrane protein
MRDLLRLAFTIRFVPMALVGFDLLSKHTARRRAVPRRAFHPPPRRASMIAAGGRSAEYRGEDFDLIWYRQSKKGILNNGPRR